MKIIAFSKMVILSIQSGFSQKVVSVYEQDTIPLRKMVKINPNLVFPVLKYPLSLCDSIQFIFDQQVAKGSALLNGFDYMNDSNNYNVSVWFMIDNSGKVAN
jgi:hypothetical protein